MPSYKVIDYGICLLVGLILFIFVVSYWFGLKYSENGNKEHFCPNKECDLAELNNAVRRLNQSIDFIESQIKQIEDTIPYNKFIKTIEGFQNNSPFSLLSELEEKLEKIQSKIKMVQLFIKARDNTFTPIKRDSNKKIECAEIKNCSNTTELEVYSLKVAELDYRINLYSNKVVEIDKRQEEIKRQRDVAINDASNQTNQVLSGVFGQPVNIDLAKNLKTGPDPKLVDAVKNGNMAPFYELAQNNPDSIQLATSKVDIQKAKPINISEGNNIINKNIGTDPDSIQKYSDAKKEIGLPQGYLQ